MSTVLLVEDSLTEMEITSRYLYQAGLKVISATSVEEAYEKMRFHKPDLIVLDIILPGQSGFEFCRSMKENTSTGSIPIILCSTKNTNADHIWGTMLGANAFVPKPIDKQQLLQTVKQLLVGQ